MPKRSLAKSAPAKVGRQLAAKLPQRNGRLFDIWSLVHLSSGIIFGWLITPAIAVALLIAWEPLEIFIFSPILARFGIVFGFENWRNSLSDIVFDTLGVIIGATILTALLTPPFHLL
jgi:CBS domain containing-hemolysin-like protein